MIALTPDWYTFDAPAYGIHATVDLHTTTGRTPEGQTFTLLTSAYGRVTLLLETGACFNFPLETTSQRRIPVGYEPDCGGRVTAAWGVARRGRHGWLR